MSHYCLAVISKKCMGEDVFSLLEPFEECKSVTYRDCTKEVLSAWNTGKTKYDAKIDKNKYENSIEKFADEYCGYETHEEDGCIKYGYWYNPNAKWDWYSIGGRWNNILKLKGKDKSEVECTNIAKIKDVDFSLDKKQYDTSMRFWELYIEDDEPTNEEERELKSSGFYKKEFYINRYKTKESYAKSCASFSTFAVLTDEGWFEQGQMGWFGCSGETDEEAVAWSNNFYNRFIKNADPEAYITIVDCHI